MEGAVRSGYIAAEALTNVAGKQQKFLVPDLPAQGFMRFFKNKSFRPSSSSREISPSEWQLTTKTSNSEKVKTVL
jgi:hypothetical protein